MNTIGKEEMRAMRREIINYYIQKHSKWSLSLKKFYIRTYEVNNYGFELKAYA